MQRTVFTFLGIIVTALLFSSEITTDQFFYSIHPATDTTLCISSKYNTVQNTVTAISTVITPYKKKTEACFKIIPSPETPQYAFLQSIFCNEVLGCNNNIITSKSTITPLNPISQERKNYSFELIPVTGERETYILKLNSFCLSYNNIDSSLQLIPYTEEKRINTKWYFKKAQLEQQHQFTPPQNKVFFLRTLNDHSLSIDIPGDNLNAVTIHSKIQMQSDNLYPGADRFIQITPHHIDKSYIFLRPLHSEFVFSIKEDSTNTGAELSLNKKGIDDISQKFKPYPIEFGNSTYYLLQSEMSGLFITANGKEQALTQERFNGKRNQLWEFEDVSAKTFTPPSDEFYIKCATTDKYWDVQGNGNETNRNYVPLQIWSYSNERDRIFTFIKDGGWCNIQVQNGGKYINVQNNSSQNHATISLFHEKQRFFIVPVSPDTFVLLTEQSKAVDVESGKTDKDGTRLIQYTIHAGENQCFKLEYIHEKGRFYTFY